MPCSRANVKKLTPGFPGNLSWRQAERRWNRSAENCTLVLPYQNQTKLCRDDIQTENLSAAVPCGAQVLFLLIRFICRQAVKNARKRSGQEKQPFGGRLPQEQAARSPFYFACQDPLIRSRSNSNGIKTYSIFFFVLR